MKSTESSHEDRSDAFERSEVTESSDAALKDESSGSEATAETARPPHSVREVPEGKPATVAPVRSPSRSIKGIKIFIRRLPGREPHRPADSPPVAPPQVSPYKDSDKAETGEAIRWPELAAAEEPESGPPASASVAEAESPPARSAPPSESLPHDITERAAPPPPVETPEDETDQATDEIREYDFAREPVVGFVEVESADEGQRQDSLPQGDREFYADASEAPFTTPALDAQRPGYLEREPIDVEFEVVETTEMPDAAVEGEQSSAELLQEIQEPGFVAEVEEDEARFESETPSPPEPHLEESLETLPAPDEPGVIIESEAGQADSESDLETPSEAEGPEFADEDKKEIFMSSVGEDVEVEPERAEEQTGMAMGDLLKQLRSRRFRQPTASQPDLAAEESLETEESVESESDVDESEGSDEDIFLADLRSAGRVIYESESEEDESLYEDYSDISDLAEKTEHIGSVVEDLSQEIRRVGRELFKTNRAADRNNEMFEDALEDLRRLSDEVARIPAQHAESLAGSVFEIKAPLCREMLRVADNMEASLTAADEVMEKLRDSAGEPAHTVFPWSRPDEQLRLALKQAVETMGEWRDGQRLLYERMIAALSSVGVRPIESVGQTFNPEMHRAVSVQRSDELPAGTIVGEESKGYTLDGRILRYAEVTVIRNE